MTAEASRSEGRTSAIRLGLDLLSRRDHFSQELATRLGDAGHPRNEIEEAIRALGDQGLLDDQRLADHRVRRWREEGRSEAECRSRLTARGVDDAIIQKSVHPALPSQAPEADPDLDPELEAAIKALRRSMGGGGRPLSPERLAARLGRRGFESDTIRAAMRHYGLDDLDIESSDGEPTA